MHFNDLVCIPVFQAYLTHYFLNKHTYFAYFLACMPLYLIHVNGSRFLFMPLIISDTHSDAHSLQAAIWLAVCTSLHQFWTMSCERPRYSYLWIFGITFFQNRRKKVFPLCLLTAYEKTKYFLLKASLGHIYWRNQPYSTLYWMTDI